MPFTESPRLGSHNRRCGQKNAIPGVVLECNEQGSLLRIRRDDLGIFQGITPGTPFYQLVDPSSIEKAFAFLAELKLRTSAFGWKLKVSLNSQPTTLYVEGMLKGSLLLIFGTRTRGGLLRYSRFCLDEDVFHNQEVTAPEQVAAAPILNEHELAIQEQLSSTQKKLANLERVLSRKKAELKQVIAELRAVRAGFHILQNLLPICSSCKKIRDEQGEWHQVEAYLRDHGGVQFTHSICPDCVQTLYPGLHMGM